MSALPPKAGTFPILVVGSNPSRRIRSHSAIVGCFVVEIFHGETSGLANRLGERELALRHYVSASRFCLHLCWNSPIPRTHDARLCVDGASVRHGIHVLDLLPARPPLPTLVNAKTAPTTTTLPPPTAATRPDNPVTTYPSSGTLQR
jgi:hypothetical protein